MPEHYPYFTFHLFAARFASHAEAELFAFEQWEAEPGPEASAAQYQAWEDHNPTWRLAQELERHLDSDFIELLPREEHPHYLESLIHSDVERQRLHSQVASDHSHFILVASAALDDQPPPRQGTKTLDYLGVFNRSLP
ncbi:hypothetical protein [Pseudomonas sp. KCJK8993]|uniref:hypothetical protein n=1 Tax=Pseudomonas sp. KCJK8993 TaxID=3344565 RepID=UPI003905D11D